MPNVGDVIQGKLIGRPWGRFIFVRCPDCDRKRWFSYKPHDSASTRRCQPCHTQFVRKLFVINKAKK
jgi:ribosomal protein S27E